jgi:hypothetical protein
MKLETIIYLLNLLCATVLAITLQERYPCLLAILLSGILGYVLLNYVEDKMTRYGMLGMGLCLYVAMQIVRARRERRPIIEKIRDSLWEYVYFTIVIYYTNDLKNRVISSR